jgi:predicted DNA-binding transcriptional regulator YafY
MRYEKLALILDLARSLAASAEGLTLDEMCHATGEQRRTVERMRDVLLRTFPQMEEIADGQSKRFRIPGGLHDFSRCPAKEELLELSKVIEELQRSGASERAKTLDGLDKKIRSAMRSSILRKVAPDLEALLHAELIAVQAGPRPVEDPGVFLAIRNAVLSMKTLRFVYHGGKTPGAVRQVVPYGIIFGRMNYLIGPDLGTTMPKNWRLDRIKDIEVLDTSANPPADFSLIKFANDSFGFFQGEKEDVVLHVLPHGVDDDFRNWRFHPNQTVEFLANGGAIVRFRASGMLELVWHLFSWGHKIEIVSPVSLRELMATELRVALAQHEGPPRYELTLPDIPAK